MWRHTALALALLGTVACDDFSSVKAEGTVEAYEKYLAENPTSSNAMQARMELEALYIAKAREEMTLEAYDAYTTKYPEGSFYADAMQERQDLLLAWAEKEWTVEGWKKFLDEYPRAEKKKKKRARKAIEVLEAADKYTVGAVEMMQINLAEDPEGELDGWQFTVPVTNQASMPIPFMKLEMHFLDEEGDTLQVDDYAVVAKDFGMPIEEERKVPIKPGETRDWIWTTGNVPAGWSRQVKVRPTAIRFDDGRPDGDE